jgi:transcriptional regulator with XRE-family HTH domain
MLPKTAIKKDQITKSRSPRAKAAPRAVHSPAEALVGARLREIRTRQGWTLKKLAEHSKLNINTLSMVEKGKTSPSVGTLQQLARALNVPITAFFESDVDTRQIIFTAHDHRPESTCCHAVIHNLGKDIRNASIEPFLISMEIDAGSGGRTIVHTGLEFAYCLSGKVQYIIEENIYPMSPGDSIVFEAHIPHRWENIHKGESEMLLVISPADHNDEPGGRHFETK